MQNKIRYLDFEYIFIKVLNILDSTNLRKGIPFISLLLAYSDVHVYPLKTLKYKSSYLQHITYLTDQ